MNASRFSLPSWPVGALLKRIARVLALLAAVIAVLMTAVWLWMTQYLLPNLDAFKPRIEAALTDAVGQRVRIGALGGRVDGVVLTLTMDRVRIENPVDGRALTLDQMQAQPSWTSLIHLEPRFHLIELNRPLLDLYRDGQGRLFLNGLQFGQGSHDGHLINWLLRQHEIRINQAGIHWRDDLAGLAALDLRNGSLVLRRGLLTHTLTLSATPPADWFSRFDAELSWSGDDITRWTDTWRGSFSLDIGGARFAPWQRYLPWMAHLPSGEGRARLSGEFAAGELTAGNAAFDLRNVLLRPDAHRDPVSVPRLSGEIELKTGRGNRHTLAARKLLAQTSTGMLFDNAALQAEWRPGRNGEGKLSVSRADLGALRPLLRVLPLGENASWNALDPVGFVDHVEASWRGELKAPTSYALKGRFAGLGWQPLNTLPGMAGVDGDIEFDQKGGSLDIEDNSGTTLTLPHVFAEPLHLNRLNADVRWTRSGDNVDVRLKKVELTNADLDATISGRYQWLPAQSRTGLIDLTASIPAVAASRVPQYLPLVVGRDTRNWLAAALKSGTARDASLLLEGNLDKFPFEHGGGRFLVTTRASRVGLEYDRAWPMVSEIDADLRFENAGMLITAQRGRIGAAAVSNTRVSIPDLGADEPHLLIDGQVDGAGMEFVRFLRNSPLNARLDNLADTMGIDGRGKLGLKLDIPLLQAEATRVAGNFTFNHNRVTLGGGVPPLEQVNGVLGFTEHGVSARGIALQALGGFGRLSVDTQTNGTMRFVATGRADSRAALATYFPLLVPHVGGMAPYTATVTIGKTLESIKVVSQLEDVTSDLPAPFAKRASETLPLAIDMRPDGKLDRLNIRLGGEASANIWLKGSDLVRGSVRVGDGNGPVPARGLTVYVANRRIDMAPWLALFGGGSNSTDSGGQAFPVTLALRTDELLAFGRQLNAVRISMSPRDGGWSGRLDAREAAGAFAFDGRGEKVQVRLSQLTLPLPHSKVDPAQNATADNRALERLPGLDVQVERLNWHDRDVGRLGINAERQGKDIWRLDRLNLSSPDGQLQLSGVQRRDGEALNSRLDVQMDSGNLGRFLARVGAPEMVRGGKGKLNGQLRWHGALVDPDSASLSGKLDIDAENVLFTKLDPGVGRLIGLTTLQSIGRRVRFDFRDIFGEGYAFDSVRGSIGIDQGIAEISELKARSPAATITFAGTANLRQDSQLIRVRVEPHLSEGVAIAAGAAMLNPVIGVGALAAQKLLQDPLGKLFSVDYLVTGSLTDPQVSKADKSSPARTDSSNGNGKAKGKGHR